MCVPKFPLPVVAWIHERAVQSQRAGTETYWKLEISETRLAMHFPSQK